MRVVIFCILTVEIGWYAQLCVSQALCLRANEDAGVVQEKNEHDRMLKAYDMIP